jgi:SAM-dependent methyltransferase
MIPKEELQTFAADTRAQAYLVVVFLAISLSFRRYYNCGNKKEGGTKPAPSVIPPLLSLVIISITWFYIFRFIVTHINTSKSYFGDAYRDVLKDEGQHMISVQLLTWAVVSVIWLDDEGQTPADLVFLGYGFLGAMSASFVLWVPSLYMRSDRNRSHGKRTVSLFCVLCAILAFLCILNISPCSSKEENCDVDEHFGSFRPSFEAWLHGLHYALVIPAIGKVVPPLQTIRVDAAVVYFIASVSLAIWHFSLLVTSKQTHLKFLLSSDPMTDCQKSITTDMVCCSFITLYSIYRDHLLTNNKETAKIDVLLKTSSVALQLALFSPASTLAFHLCSRCAGDSHMAFVSRMQRLMARKRRAETVSAQKAENKSVGYEKPSWCNLGLWRMKKELLGYDDACERLALALATTAGLNAEDGVLCCGCGSGPELELYKSKFQVKHITGIDPEMDRVQSWERNRLLRDGDFNIRRIKASVEDLATSTSGDALFPPALFSKIMALDNVYHYPSKYNFLRDCIALLPPGGRVAVTDILLDKTPIWVRWFLVLFGIPYQNQWTKKQYIQHLNVLGYVDIDIQSTKGGVFSGWEDYLPRILTETLDYSIIVAALPTKERPEKKRIAIVGSGLAGLTAAHSLVNSSANVKVTIFEGNDRPGLAGNSEWYEDHLIDIPPRMASRGYYKEYRKMLNELKLPTQTVNTDCTYYGGDENGGGNTVYAYYDESYVGNFFFAILRGGYTNFMKVAFAMSKTGEEVKTDENCKVSTFGAWLKKYNLYSSCTTDSLDMCRDNPFLYLIIGSLGWMLSCTYQQLLEYPTDIVMPYLHSLYLSSIAMRGDGQVIRVSPSIKILEQTLLYGIEELSCGVRVSNLDKTNKIINGVKYDSIICATEASAVPKVLKDAPKVFSKVRSSRPFLLSIVSLCLLTTCFVFNLLLPLG